MLDEWGWGENTNKTAAFQTVTAARITHHKSSDRQLFELSVKPNLGTCPVRILVAMWGCVCMCHTHMCTRVYISNRVVSEEWKGNIFYFYCSIVSVLKSIVNYPDESHCLRGNLENVYFVVLIDLSITVLSELHTWFSFC